MGSKAVELSSDIVTQKWPEGRVSFQPKPVPTTAKPLWARLLPSMGPEWVEKPSERCVPEFVFLVPSHINALFRRLCRHASQRLPATSPHAQSSRLILSRLINAALLPAKHAISVNGWSPLINTLRCQYDPAACRGPQWLSALHISTPFLLATDYF